MRMVRRWSGVSKIVLAIVLVAWTGVSASASTLVTYSTSGTIDSIGVTGSPVISFLSLNDASFNSPSYFSLGDFKVAPLQTGQTTTYTHTPFHITLVVDQVNNGVPVPNAPVVLNGFLDGKINGAKQSTVRATFTPVGNLTFQTGSFDHTMTIPDLQVTLVPSTTNSGLTTAEAHLDTTPSALPVPEPASIALFLTTLTGLGLRQRLRAQRPT